MAHFAVSGSRAGPRPASRSIEIPNTARLARIALCQASYGNLDQHLSPIIGMRTRLYGRQSAPDLDPRARFSGAQCCRSSRVSAAASTTTQVGGLPAIKTNRILVPTQGYHFPLGWDEGKCISRIRRIILRGCQFAAPPSYRIFRGLLRASLPAATSSVMLFSSSVTNRTSVPDWFRKIPSGDTSNQPIMLPTPISWGCISSGGWSVLCAFRSAAQQRLISRHSNFFQIYWSRS